jgi:arsenate reductase-like glutaredoxin family protein
LKFLDSRGTEYRSILIRETPPSRIELRKMLEYLDGDLKKLFNTSGLDYRKLDIKSKLPGMTPAQAINMLAGNGNLIKRPQNLVSENIYSQSRSGWCLSPARAQQGIGVNDEDRSGYQRNGHEFRRVIPGWILYFTP